MMDFWDVFCVGVILLWHCKPRRSPSGCPPQLWLSWGGIGDWTGASTYKGSSKGEFDIQIDTSIAVRIAIHIQIYTQMDVHMGIL